MPKICTLSRKQRDELQTLIDAYDTARAALHDRTTEITDEWDEAINDKSDKWRESDAGEAAQERLDSPQSWRDEIPETSPSLGDIDH